MAKKVSVATILCFVLAAGFIAADIAAIIALSDFLSNSETVQGRVVDYRKERSRNRGGSSYLYTVQFTAKDGREYQTFTYSGSHERGDAVEVTYDRRNPQEAAASSMDQWIFVILFSAGAVIAGLVGVARLKAS